MKKYLVTLMLLSGCSSVPPICKPENAQKAGVAQAMRGENLSTSVGSVCEDEHFSTFKNSFQAGYVEGKNRYCSAKYLIELGNGDGLSGKEKQFTGMSFQICDTTSGLESAYDQGYQQGLLQFCSESEMEKKGFAYGEKGRVGEYDEPTYSVCGKKKVAQLKTKFAAGHAAGLKKFCFGENVGTEAFTAGASGQTKEEVLEKFALCTGPQKKKIVQTYETNFDKGVEEFCKADRLDRAAIELAGQTNTLNYPPKYDVCFQKHPDRKETFGNRYREERERIVMRDCTFDKGVQLGRKDAQKLVQKNTTLPDFCDKSLFGVYLNGYLEGWRIEKDRVCNESEAYNKGMLAGRRGDHSGYAPPTICPPEYHSRMRQKYTEGFQIGSTQAAIPTSSVYTPQEAQRACMAAGFKDYQCMGVTSIVCIEKGYNPYQCNLPTRYLATVDQCLRMGHNPTSCKDVSDFNCINQGKNPIQCR